MLVDLQNFDVLNIEHALGSSRLREERRNLRGRRRRRVLHDPLSVDAQQPWLTAQAHNKPRQASHAMTSASGNGQPQAWYTVRALV